MSFVDEATHEQDIENLRNALDRSQRALAKEKDRTARVVREVYQAAQDAALGRPKIQVPTPPKDKRKAVGNPEVAVAWVSDIQLGKVTPDYNSEVAAERVKIYTKKVLEIVAMHRSARPIEKLHLWLTGDIVEGEDIFPGNQWLIDSSLYAQAIKNGPSILAQLITELLAEFREIHVSAVIGNHGRVGRKGQFHPETNMDRMCYEVTRQMFSHESRVTWDIAEPGNTGERGWFAVDHIGNYSCLLVHGDQFRGSLGVPWYGIRKKVLGWKAMASDPYLAFPAFQDIAFGHWHQSVTWTVNGIGVRGIGSPESRNDFAAEMLAGMSRPSQRLLFVDPEAGHVTADYVEIWLDEA